MQGAFICVGWQVTLCDPIWQVTLRSSVMGFQSIKSYTHLCLFYVSAACALPTENDVARGTYNVQQVQLAFAYAYHVLCNAVRADDCAKNSTSQQFLCTNSVLSCVICMPHHSDPPDDRDNFSRQKLTSGSGKLSHRKHTTPRKKHKLSVTR